MILRTTEVKDILDFWFPNDKYNEFWFDRSVDDIIRIKFGSILVNIENQLKIRPMTHDDCNMLTNDELLALIILLDQFTRNLNRNPEDNFRKNDQYAFSIATYLIETNRNYDYPIYQRIFILLPYRHQKNNPNYVSYLNIVLDKIATYEKGQLEQKDIQLLEKFKIATFRNFTELINYDLHIHLHDRQDEERYNMTTYKTIREKYANNILDQICYNYKTDPVYADRFKINTYSTDLGALYKTILNVIEKLYPNIDDRNIGVSLSGGVDSMVLAFILKHMQIRNQIKSVMCVHIYYGNRTDSLDETNFIKDWCEFYEIPLIIKYIKYMRRETVDRTFYEEETRKIRFNIYKYAIDNYGIKGFCLGHHADDIAENVFMNMLTGRNISDLCVMTETSIIDNVLLLRPMLSHHKVDVVTFAEKHLIPFTKDTTPDSSCRGVLRRRVFPILQNQFGNFALNMINLGDNSTELKESIDVKVKRILTTVTIGKLGCYLNVEDCKNETSVFWSELLVKLFHTMGKNMIKVRTVKLFLEWIRTSVSNENIFSFSNDMWSILCNDVLYIIKQFNITEWNVSLEEINSEKRNKITYSDIVHGLIEYTERYIDSSPIVKIEKFSKQDTTKKLFSDINDKMHSRIPKYSSGVYKASVSDDIKIKKIIITYKN